MPRKNNEFVISITPGGFSCPKCEYHATNQRAMKLHIRVSHGEKSRLEDSNNIFLECSSCGKNLKRNKLCSCLRV